MWCSTFQGHGIFMQEEDTLIAYFKDTNMLFAGPFTHAVVFFVIFIISVFQFCRSSLRIIIRHGYVCITVTNNVTNYPL